MTKEEAVAAVSANIESCRFIAFSAIPISDAIKDTLSDSEDITWGDANRTMITLDRLARELAIFDYAEGEDDIPRMKNDAAIMNALIDEFGGDFYVDLEN